MIIVDTNVISELMRSSPKPEVISWIDKQDATLLFVTTITIAEIIYGIKVLPEGNRRRALEDSFNRALDAAFKHRILSFDESAAHLYGDVMGKRKLSGKPLSIPDGQIASIALAHNFSVATRNIKDFEGGGLNLLNPFV